MKYLEHLKFVSSHYTPSEIDDKEDDVPFITYTYDKEATETYDTKVNNDSYLIVKYSIPSGGTYSLLGSSFSSVFSNNCIKMYVNGEEVTPSLSYTFNESGEYIVKFVFKRMLSSLSYLLNNKKSLETEIDVNNLNTNNNSSLNYAFSGIYKCNGIKGVNYLDTSNVTNMEYTFNESNFTSLDLHKWNTSKVTATTCMFLSCSGLTSIEGLNNWDMSKNANFPRMFQDCSGLTSLDLSNWNVSKIFDGGNLFYRCCNLESVGDLSNWNPSTCVSFGSAFFCCYKLSTIGNLKNWDVSKMTSFGSMFRGCSNLLTVGDLSNWKPTKCTRMANMFGGCKLLNSIGIPLIPSGCDTSSMFGGCVSLTTILNSGTISSSVSFASCPLNHDSAIVLINALDSTVSGQTLTLKSTTVSSLTEDEIKIATDKGWTVASA